MGSLLITPIYLMNRTEQLLTCQPLVLVQFELLPPQRT